MVQRRHQNEDSNGSPVTIEELTRRQGIEPFRSLDSYSPAMLSSEKRSNLSWSVGSASSGKRTSPEPLCKLSSSAPTWCRPSSNRQPRDSWESRWRGAESPRASTRPGEIQNDQMSLGFERVTLTSASVCAVVLLKRYRFSWVSARAPQPTYVPISHFAGARRASSCHSPGCSLGVHVRTTSPCSDSIETTGRPGRDK